ncbi:MAG: DUF72 domain-containing protein [Ignavibacteriaceae bacterium]
MAKTKFYIGTAGWKYDDWIGSFYPKKETSNFDWLQFYSHYFNCIEVNSTYYVYLSDKVVNAWVRKTEDLDDFIFTLKLHQDFTHKRSYTKQNIDSTNYVLNILNKAGRLGGLLIQFPQSFKFDPNSAAYIKKLNELFGQHGIFLEVRHGSFHTKEALDFFRTERINCITIDQPQVGNAIAFKPVVTGSCLYFRLHGRNKEDWFKGFDKMDQPKTDTERNARYNYLYSPGELVEMVDEIKASLSTAEKVIVITNNHPKGNAVANAFQLISMLENRLVEIPETTLKCYPELKEIAEQPHPQSPSPDKGEEEELNLFG